MKTELNNAELQLQYQNVVAPVGIVFDPEVKRRVFWQVAKEFFLSSPRWFIC